MRILIIGAGDIGKPMTHYLSERGHLVTVVDKDEKKCKEIANHSDAAIFQCSGVDSRVWKSIEADKTDALLALTNDDEINIRVCEIAKKQFGIPFVIARAHQPENMSHMKESGADIVICPSQETLNLFLNALESLTVETLYQDMMTNFKIAKVTIPINGSAIGITANQLGIPENCRIIGIFRNGMLLFPTESFVFKGRDKVLISGSLEFVEEIAEKLTRIEST